MNGVEATRKVIDALETLGIEYMLVGSFSSNYYGIPRSTKDADFVVVLGGVSVTQLSRELGDPFLLDPQTQFETATGTMKNVFTIAEIPFTIELFRLSDDAHDQERFRRRQRVQLAGRSVFLPTAEDVIITKLRWAVTAARAKDTDDVRDVLAVQGDALDFDYIHHWCDQHGTRDKLDEIRGSIPPIP